MILHYGPLWHSRVVSPVKIVVKSKRGGSSMRALQCLGFLEDPSMISLPLTVNIGQGSLD
jgi:hypothetical protein